MSKKEKSREHAKESHAYTPGLKIKNFTTIDKDKRLPISGEVLVKKGEKVDFNTIVARTTIRGMPYLVNVAGFLNIEANEIEQFMVKKVGDFVSKDETIAIIKILFGLIKNIAKSPVDGSIESLSIETGRVIIREPASSYELIANTKGIVLDVIPKYGAIIRTEGAYIQGIFGIGGEKNGELIFLADSPEEVVEASNISSVYKGKIILVGALVTEEILSAALKYGVVGIIAGGIDFTTITDLIGEEIGVAITGEEKVGLTLIITEGLGKMNMANKTFNILKDLEHKLVAIDGTTQIRAGVIRPEIICPKEVAEQDQDITNLETGIKPGTLVRIIQSPYFGMLGTVINLPVALRQIETESMVRVVEIKLENDENIIIPRANLEILEV